MIYSKWWKEKTQNQEHSTQQGYHSDEGERKIITEKQAAGIREFFVEFFLIVLWLDLVEWRRKQEYILERGNHLKKNIEKEMYDLLVN